MARKLVKSLFFIIKIIAEFALFTWSCFSSSLFKLVFTAFLRAVDCGGPLQFWQSLSIQKSIFWTSDFTPPLSQPKLHKLIMFWACPTAGWVFIGNPWVFTARREAIALSHNIAILQQYCDVIAWKSAGDVCNWIWSSSQWCSQHVDMQCCATMFDTRAKKMCLQSLNLVYRKTSIP